MQDEGKSQLSSRIHESFEFLSEMEIAEFIRTHSWLEKETELGIIVEYLANYSKGLSDHYNNLHSRLLKCQEEMNLGGPVTKKPKQGIGNESGGSEKMIIETEKEERKNENDKLKVNDSFGNNQSNSVQESQNFEKDQNLFSKIMVPSEDEVLMSLIKKLDEIRSLCNELGESNQAPKHFEFVYNILWRIMEFPTNPNFRQVQIDPVVLILANFVVDILELLGFVRCDLDEKITMIYTEDSMTFFKNALEFIESEYCPDARKTIDKAVQRNLASHNTPQPQSNYSVSERVKAQMEAQNERMKQGKTHNDFEIGDGRVTSLQNQIRDYRNRMRNRNMQMNQFSGQNIMTMNQLYTNQELSYANNNNPASNPGFSSRFVSMDDIEKKRIEEDKVSFGKKALQYTNEFRKKQGLKPVEWNQHLCDIGMKHSRDMAEQKVPFGHQGFENRVKSIVFSQRSVCENVAYCSGVEDVPRVIVDGWIKSPGHRKNLLSDSNVCGIAVYRSKDGRWYFTQLLAMKN